MIPFFMHCFTQDQHGLFYIHLVCHFSLLHPAQESCPLPHDAVPGSLQPPPATGRISLLITVL